MTKHVLVVDDDANLGAVLEAELTKRDFQVTLLQSPEEAISRIETGGDVDVVLTDFQMQAQRARSSARASATWTARSPSS